MFIPGFKWRVLAHRRPGKTAELTDQSFDVRSGHGRSAHGTREMTLELGGDWEFDEVVIDHWFHLEQMAERVWWIGVGDPGSDYWHINVRINDDETTEVSVEKQ